MAKSKWDQVMAKFAEIEGWLKAGLNESQIYKNLGIGKTTWESYKHSHPELLELLKNGRASQVNEVENSLYKNATGFYYFVDEVHKVKDRDGNEQLQVVQVKKFKPPETAAVCFFLKNKDKKNWCDNPQMIEIKREELDVRKKANEFKEW